ncbi:MAG: thermonuclease family protein [Pseudomonadota bacterium]
MGIDAPEGPQTCMRDGKPWTCGRAATQRLRALVSSDDVSCEVEDRDQHGRLLSVCRSRGRDVNAEMVRTGYAVAFGRRYQSLEREARTARRGLWSGTFERPQQWRRKNMN